MLPLFLTSLSVLVGLFLLRTYETHTNQRYARRVRATLDRYAGYVLGIAQYAMRKLYRAAHGGVLVRILGVVSYGTLISIRWIERRLLQLVYVLRRFRRAQEVKEPSHKLAAVRGSGRQERVSAVDTA